MLLHKCLLSWIILLLIMQDVVPDNIQKNQCHCVLQSLAPMEVQGVQLSRTACVISLLHLTVSGRLIWDKVKRGHSCPPMGWPCTERENESLLFVCMQGPLFSKVIFSGNIVIIPGKQNLLVKDQWWDLSIPQAIPLTLSGYYCCW